MAETLTRCSGQNNGYSEGIFVLSSDMIANLKRFFPQSPWRSGRFRLRGYGIREEMPPGFVNRPEGTGDFLMMYFHTNVRAGIGPEAAEVAAGSLWIWAPGEHQFYGRWQRRYSHSWIHCEGQALERVLKIHSPVSLPAGTFIRFLEGLHEEVSGRMHPDSVIAENLLENWLRELDRELSSQAPAVPERLRRVRDFMDAHYARPLTLPGLARMADWSVAHFSERFRQAYGVPPMEYVIRARIDHAAHLLRDVNLSVTEIARRVGYEDLYHFSKLFKRHRGVSPGRIRRQSRA
jgi:AraC family transcriptional regulator of arabinose operon